jgi:hypothetical protein
MAKDADYVVQSRGIVREVSYHEIHNCHVEALVRKRQTGNHAHNERALRGVVVVSIPETGRCRLASHRVV